MASALDREIAARLRDAEKTATPIEPFAQEIGESNIIRAYEIQHLNTHYGLSAGRRFSGRKIGLTAAAVQQQLGVDEPDYGALFADMQIENGGSLDRSAHIAPRIEAEIAFLLGRDIDREGLPFDELERYVDRATSALEIVDSRLKNWRIGIVDTIADNGASSRFVLGDDHVSPREMDLAACTMTLTKNGTVVSTGTGAATLGHPLKALRWLADTLIMHGYPLRAGDVVLTGALGPVCSLEAGDVFEANFDGLPSVEVTVR